MTRRPSKAQRRAALAELLAGLPEPAELPEEAEASTTSEIIMLEDGKLLTGSDWIKPQDFAEAEVADGSLPSMKGCTPSEWPGLDDDQAREVTHDNERTNHDRNEKNQSRRAHVARPRRTHVG